MQDHIPDALIAAFERQYDASWNDPQLRNERLAMRYGWAAAIEQKQCLFQIQEPVANQQLTAVPMTAMTNALREAEAALEVALARILKADPGHSTSVTSEAKALVAVRQALSAKAAPVAVGEREAFERELIDNHHYVPSDFSFKDGFYGGGDDYIQFGWDIWQARAALAATPAEPRHEAAVILEAIAQEPPINGNEIAKARTLMAARALRAATQAAVPAIPKWIDDPHDIEQGQMLNPEWVKLQETTKPEDHSEQVLDMVAAPVVLPEPDLYVRPSIAAYELPWQVCKGSASAEPAYLAETVRALLATGGRAQAVASIYVTEDGQREVDDWRVPLPAGSNLLYTAPQAQAVERGEVLVTVSGFTGSGKSAIAGEIEILCRALGLQVEWPDGESEKNMTHADWTAALEQYKPRVRIVEQNIPFVSKKGLSK